VILGVTVYQGIPMVSPWFFMSNPLSSKEKKYRKKKAIRWSKKECFPCGFLRCPKISCIRIVKWYNQSRFCKKIGGL